MKSLSVTSRIDFNEQSIEQCQVISEQYVITTNGGKASIFLPGHNAHYIVHENEKLLKKADLTVQVQQMEVLKKMIGEIYCINEDDNLSVAGFETKCKSFCNSANGIKIQGKLYYSKIDGIEGTAWAKSRLLDNSVQLFSGLLNTDDFVFKMDMVLDIQGNIQTQNIEVLNVEKIDAVGTVYEGYLDYRIS